MKDPIVDEVRNNRVKLAKSYGFDVNKIMVATKKNEQARLIGNRTAA